MILFDTETTGLIKNIVQPLAQQPRIVEFAAVRLEDATLREVKHIVFRVNPGFVMDPEAVKITGISNEDVKDCPPFSAFLKPLTKFFLGEETLVAHNVAFDRDMLMLELERLDARTRFPWPSNHICTVEMTRAIKGYRLKLAELYELATGATMTERGLRAHGALDDVRALAEVVRWARTQELL
jgi:DNA polymerase-3 subunit epsilon